MPNVIIAIDGPAGSGKSTVARAIAKGLGFLYIDTGAMYRALTLKAMRERLDLKDRASLTRMAESALIELKEESGAPAVFLDGEDVTGLIRTNELTNNVKYVASVPGVRAVMVRMQRALGEKMPSVLEGRDIGTVVFPDAAYKFYLDADVAERARRRQKDLLASGADPGLEEIKRDVRARDDSDMRREVGALKKARDAVYIDTTTLTADEVAGEIMRRIREKRG